MSNSLAISAVTATLRDLLTQGIHADAELVDAEISTAPLDKTPKNDALPQVNLFLYGASPNTGWMNGDPPSARPGEESRPALALDLHYLVTVFGKADDDVVAHRLLGRTMRILHDHPVLGRDEIRNALDGNDLGDQVERVRITPQPLTLDEMSKLWTSFQREYRMSTAYHVSVVLIESDRPARTPLPVLTRGEGDLGVDVVPEPVSAVPDARARRAGERAGGRAPGRAGSVHRPPPRRRVGRRPPLDHEDRDSGDPHGRGGRRAARVPGAAPRRSRRRSRPASTPPRRSSHRRASPSAARTTSRSRSRPSSSRSRRHRRRAIRTAT